MFRKFFTIIGTIGIFAGGLALIAIMGALKPKKEFEKPAEVPPSVFYMVAQPQAITLDVRVQGEVRARTDINLTAQVSGRITELSPSFVDGGAFQKNDMLVKIEDADYRLAVTRAQARVAQAQQVLRQEQAESELAGRDWQELGNGTKPADLTLRLPQLAQASASYDAAKADLQEARLNLARATVRAPFDGRVRRRIAGEGQFVGPGAQLGQIFATDIAEIRLPLTDANLATLGLPFGFTETSENPGPSVKLTATIGASSNQWVGRIARTEGTIDPATRQIGAIAVVDDPYGKGADNGVPLAIGLFVEAEIEGRPYNDAIVIASSALYGRDTVYIVNASDELEKRNVTVASVSSNTVVIVAGLSSGDRVVTSPLRGSDEGDKVTPVEPDATLPLTSDRNSTSNSADVQSAGEG